MLFLPTDLHSVINNAGVMVFGEFEWQTDEMIYQQLTVNLLGSMKVTKEFLPFLRKYKGTYSFHNSIVFIYSACALDND